jgi:hypothetical protein
MTATNHVTTWAANNKENGKTLKIENALDTVALDK